MICMIYESDWNQVYLFRIHYTHAHSDTEYVYAGKIEQITNVSKAEIKLKL